MQISAYYNSLSEDRPFRTLGIGEFREKGT